MAAGLRPSDILLAIDGVRFNDARAFMRKIIETPVGQAVKLTIWRGGIEQVVITTVAEWPRSSLPTIDLSTRMAARENRAQDDGLTLAPLTEESRKQYGIDGKVSGALVTSVDKDSEARDLGIVPGDVLTFVQNEAVSNPDDVQSALAKAYDEQLPFAAVLVQGKSSLRWVSFDIGDH
jgi:serine protease Do